VEGADYDLFHDSLKGMEHTKNVGAALTEQLYAAMNDLYLKGEMLAIPVGYNSATKVGINENGILGEDFAFDGYLNQKGGVDAWHAFKFRVVESGEYNIGVKLYWLNANNNGAIDAYLLAADTTDIAAALTDANKLGTIKMDGTKLAAKATYNVTIAKKQAMEEGQYILVLKVAADLSGDNNRVDLMIPGMIVEKYAPSTEAPKYTNGNFTFNDVNITNYSETHSMAQINAGPNYDLLAERYDINGWKAAGAKSAKGYMGLYKGDMVNDGSTVLQARDLAAGDWIAIQFKNPGTGSFDISLKMYRTSNTKANVNFYIIPASTTDIESALTNANLYLTMNTYSETGVANGESFTAQMSKKLTSTAGGGDYILVLKIAELTNSAASCRVFLGDMTIAGMSASTGDNTPVVLLGFIALISLGAICFVSKKRFAC
jgi:hypothetical protein